MNPDDQDPGAPFPCEPIPPELLAWARQTFDENEFLAQIREMEANGGGSTLDDFIAEIEARATGE